MDEKSFEEKFEKHQTKVSNTMKAMASKVTARVQDLIKELAEVKKDIKRIDNNDNKHCHCNGKNEDFRTDLKSLETRINSLEETVTAESTELGKCNINYDNQIQMLKEKSINNQQEIKYIDDKLRKLEEDHIQLMETSQNREHEPVAEVRTINDELNECLPNSEMETTPPLENKISGRNFSQTSKCKLCDKRYDQFANLKAHMKADHPCKFNCNYCDLKFSNRFNLEEHLVDVHEKKKNIQCDQCDIKFLSNWKYAKHLMLHQETSRRMCHYFNNNKECPFEKSGCKFAHKDAPRCENNNLCTRTMCQYKH